MPSQKKITIAACIAIVGFACAFLLIAYTPLRNLIPGYPSEGMRNEIAANAMKIDSLERSIYRWELYSRNLRDVLNGKAPIQIDSLLKMAEQGSEGTQASANAGADSILRLKIKAGRKQNIHGSSSHQPLEGRHFFTPVYGTVTTPFELSLHPYVDISAPQGSTVFAALDGTVIFKDWNETDGWSIVLQHSGGVISIYKHNDSILRSVADKVSAGSAIAILGGNTFDSSKGPHLHFELWLDGEPENPERFINFQK